MSLLENELPSDLSNQGTAGINHEDNGVTGRTAPGSSLEGRQIMPGLHLQLTQFQENRFQNLERQLKQSY